MDSEKLLSLIIYFVVMLGIGAYAWRKSTADLSDYILGGRKLGPWVTALSAGASDMSGWLLLGLPGAAYVSGLSVSWIAIGLIAGAFANYQLVAPRLRVQSELAGNALTIPAFFENRFKDYSHLLRIVSALIIVIFFTLYTSSGMVSGGKLWMTAFDGDYTTGLWLTAGVVAVYSTMGGFRGVSLTDVVQGIIMLVALVLMPIVAMGYVGGPSVVAGTLKELDMELLSLTSGMTLAGVISALGWGLGYFGQPHIIVRFMAIRSHRELPLARTIGMSWMIVSLAGAIAVGLTGLAYAQRTGLEVTDPEAIFIILSDLLFHPLIAGFLLAGIMAAVMSTISSQLIVLSGSLCEDFYMLVTGHKGSQRMQVLVGRIFVLVVTLIAISLALNPEGTVLGLVASAWAGLGASFGPVILLSLWWKRTTRNGALAGMVIGASVVLFWRYAPVLQGGQPLSSLIYELVPGFFLSLLAIAVVSLKGQTPVSSAE